WDAVSPRLARTDDVRSALLPVERGEAPAGIVYATDAAASKAVMIAGIFPADSHDPVSYPFAVTKLGDIPEARGLMTFLAGPDARVIFEKRGFKVEWTVALARGVGGCPADTGGGGAGGWVRLASRYRHGLGAGTLSFPGPAGTKRSGASATGAAAGGD